MGFHVLDNDGQIIGFVETEEEALALLAQVPDDIYVFFVGGQADDVQRFMLQLNGGLGRHPTFFETLAEKYGKVPETINPFEEIKDEFFRNTAFFIKIRYDLLNSRAASQLLSVLNRTLAAGSSFFVIIEKREIEDGLVMSSSGETVEVFYAPATEPEDGPVDVGETVLTAPVM
jgi:hypothetical protein